MSTTLRFRNKGQYKDNSMLPSNSILVGEEHRMREDKRISGRETYK